MDSMAASNGTAGDKVTVVNEGSEPGHEESVSISFVKEENEDSQKNISNSKRDDQRASEMLNLDNNALETDSKNEFDLADETEQDENAENKDDDSMEVNIQNAEEVDSEENNPESSTKVQNGEDQVSVGSELLHEKKEIKTENKGEQDDLSKNVIQNLSLEETEEVANGTSNVDSIEEKTANQDEETMAGVTTTASFAANQEVGQEIDAKNEHHSTPENGDAEEEIRNKEDPPLDDPKAAESYHKLEGVTDEPTTPEKDQELNDEHDESHKPKESEGIATNIAQKLSTLSDNLKTTENENVNKDENTDITVTEDTDVEEQTKEKEWLDILGNGLLKKKVLVSGHGQETRPKPGNEVTLKVNGELGNGAKLGEETLVFIMDDRDVVQAIEMGVALMEVGEQCILYTDSKYAYGPFGCNDTVPKVPKNCSITYDLELISVAEGPDKETLSDSQRIEIADKKRVRGNMLYISGDFGGAIDCYKRGLKYLEGSGSEGIIEMKVKCQNNLSAAQLKLNAYQAALQSCNNVLSLQSKNIKAMFRKAKCLEALGNAKDALKCLKEASMLDPSNKLINGELVRLGKYVKQSQQKESDMYKRMVGTVKKDEAGNESADDNFSFKVMVGTLLVVGIGVLASFVWSRH